MNTYNRILLTLCSLSSVLLVGCSEDGFEAFEGASATSVTTNTGVISQKNFSVLADDWAPQVISAEDGSFTQTDVTLTVYTGDRNNETVTNPHTIYFVSEYGLINPPSCETDSSGTCSVTWSAIKSPDPGGPGSDYRVTVTAYAIGEEAFTDTNGNGLFDDGDAGFADLEEPYVDVDAASGGGGDGMYSAGDIIIDVVSTSDPTGINGQHDIADGFFNGPGCTHSSLCSTRPSVAIWDDIVLYIDGPPTTP